MGNLIPVHFYAALLPRRGPHIASQSVCLSVRLSDVPLSYFSARTEGRISYGHLGRTDSCLWNTVYLLQFCATGWKWWYSATDISVFTEQSFPLHNCWSADFQIILGKDFTVNIMINRRKFPEKNNFRTYLNKQEIFWKLSAFASFSVVCLLLWRDVLL